MERKQQYGGVPEKEYPAWMCRVKAALRPKLVHDASVLLVIRSHVRNAVMSDYVLRTRLALREDGWCECEELIWLKPNAPPLGSKDRRRRTWENILWFSKTPKPYFDLKGSGTFSDRIGFVGSGNYAENGKVAAGRSQRHRKHRRMPDAGFIRDEGGEMVWSPCLADLHILCEKLIRTFSRDDDLVLDPFAGSATTLVAAQQSGRKWVGFDINPKYVEIAQRRLETVAADATHHSATTLNTCVRLRPDFPQRPVQRRTYLLVTEIEFFGREGVPTSS